MEKLRFSNEVFEAGTGRIYELLIKITFPAMLAGILLIALINTGLLARIAGAPEWAKTLFILLIVVYVVPGLFVLPTVWMLRSWKIRDMRESYILAGKKSIEYHKASGRMTGVGAEKVYTVTQIKKVEEDPRKLTVIGNVLEKGSGVTSSQLVIPKAFENMDLIRRAARYR